MAFKKCISHSCKSRCADLQFLDKHHARRNVNELGAEEMPRNLQTTRYTGVKMVSNREAKGRANADLKIEDTKEGLLELLRGDGGGTDLHRAPVELLDKVWGAALLARGESSNKADGRGQEEDCPECPDDDGYRTE